MSDSVRVTDERQLMGGGAAAVLVSGDPRPRGWPEWHGRDSDLDRRRRSSGWDRVGSRDGRCSQHAPRRRIPPARWSSPTICLTAWSLLITRAGSSSSTARPSGSPESPATMRSAGTSARCSRCSDGEGRCWWQHSQPYRRACPPGPGIRNALSICPTAPSCWSLSAMSAIRVARDRGRAGTAIRVRCSGSRSRCAARSSARQAGAQPCRPGLHRRP